MAGGAIAWAVLACSAGLPILAHEEDAHALVVSLRSLAMAEYVVSQCGI